MDAAALGPQCRAVCARWPADHPGSLVSPRPPTADLAYRVTAGAMWEGSCAGRAPAPANGAAHVMLGFAPSAVLRCHTVCVAPQTAVAISAWAADQTIMSCASRSSPQVHLGRQRRAALRCRCGSAGRQGQGMSLARAHPLRLRRSVRGTRDAAPRLGRASWHTALSGLQFQRAADDGEARGVSHQVT